MPKKTEPKDTQSTQPEQVQQVRISDIHPFKNHPFKVVDDALMQETVDSIMQFGVLNPTIIRPDPGGGYEMVAGHRRLHASGLAGKDTIPAIVRNLTDDEAVILLVDTNLQRENISPTMQGENAPAFSAHCNTIDNLCETVMSVFEKLGYRDRTVLGMRLGFDPHKGFVPTKVCKYLEIATAFEMTLASSASRLFHRICRRFAASMLEAGR